MPSTETRRMMDLITLIRELVNSRDMDSEPVWKEGVHREIWDMASKEEQDAILEFCSWFQQK